MLFICGRAVIAKYHCTSYIAVLRDSLMMGKERGLESTCTCRSMLKIEFCVVDKSPRKMSDLTILPLCSYSIMLLSFVVTVSGS